MLLWGHDGELGAVPSQLMRRTFFSYCGKLVGHFAVCGWLRVAVAYVKRRANLVTQGWDNIVDGDDLRVLLEEIIEKVKRDNPVRGRWDVRGNSAKVWVDASSLAMGAAFEVEGNIIEDASCRAMTALVTSTWLN